MGFDGPMKSVAEREAEEKKRQEAQLAQERRRAEERYRQEAPAREAAARERRLQHLNQLSRLYYPIITAETLPPITVPLMPEQVPLSVDARTALTQALHDYDSDKMEILMGPDDTTEIAQSLFHDPKFHRRFAVYSVYLSALRDYWHSLSDEAAKEIFWSAFISEHPDEKDSFIDKKTLQQAMQACAKEVGSPLAQYSLQYLTSTLGIERLDAAYHLDLSHSPSSQYVAEIYRANPFVSLDRSTVEAHCQAYAYSVYQTKVQAYFSRFPEERTILEPLVVSSEQRRRLDVACGDVAWECYQKANASNKKKALTHLVLLWKRVPETLFPLSPVKIRECEEDWPLLKELFLRYQPKNDRDRQLKKALLALIEKPERVSLSSLVPTLLASALPWEMTFPQEQAAWENVLNNPRSASKDAIYLSLYYGVTEENHISDYDKKRQARQNLLHDWYEARIANPPSPHITQTLAEQTCRKKTPLIPSPPFLTARKEAIQTIITQYAAENASEQTKTQLRGLLDVLLGPKAFQASASAAQWFYQPQNLVALQTFWTLLLAAQMGYQQVKATEGEIAAKAMLDKPLHPTHQADLTHFLETLYRTHQVDTRHIPSLRNSGLEILESTYQRCLEKMRTPHDKAFMQAGLDMSPDDFSLRALQNFAQAQEKRAYLQRVQHHLIHYPDDLPKVMTAFGIEAPETAEGLRQDEINVCLLLTLEEEKFLSPATFEKQDAQSWMEKQGKSILKHLR